MSDLHKNKLLAEKIAAVIECGIKINKESLHFINSTFNYPTLEELSRMLLDADSCDALTVCELLMFPDEAIQILFEPDLIKNKYAQSDLSDICRMVCREKPSVHLCFADELKTVHFTAPESAVRKFIQRLNVFSRIDGPIDQALARYIQDPTDYLKARVRLRNRRFEFSEPILDFLIELISKTYPARTVFWEALDYMIDFFNTFPSIKGIGSALGEKKRDCIQLLDMADRNNKALQKNAVEALLMKGMRITSVCVEEIKKEINLIDYILTAIFD
jgi:hypothetical protein